MNVNDYFLTHLGYHTLKIWLVDPAGGDGADCGEPWDAASQLPGPSEELPWDGRGSVRRPDPAAWLRRATRSSYSHPALLVTECNDKAYFRHGAFSER
jgi:hypothetical protein